MSKGARTRAERAARQHVLTLPRQRGAAPIPRQLLQAEADPEWLIWSASDHDRAVLEEYLEDRDRDWFESDPAGFLAAAAAEARHYAERVDQAVAEARREDLTWDEIAAALGISKQAAWRRYRSDEAEAGGRGSAKRQPTSTDHGPS